MSNVSVVLEKHKCISSLSFLSISKICRVMTWRCMKAERKDFYIEHPDDFNAWLVRHLIHYNTHRFKRLKDVDILSRKWMDRTIESVL